MTNNIDVFFEVEENKEIEDILKNIANTVIEYIKPDFLLTLSITVTNNENIHEINLSERGVDKPTDVLSFPMLFYSEPEVLLHPLTDADYDLELKKVSFGDIVISKEKVEEQAVEYGHSFMREFTYLTVHGILHLFGYDHMEDNDKKIMRKKEDEIMEMLKL